MRLGVAGAIGKAWPCPPRQLSKPAGWHCARPRGATLALATPLAAQQVGDDVGSVEDPQGDPDDPQPDAPSVSTAAEPEEPPSLQDPFPEVGPPPEPTGDDGLNAAGDREIDFESDVLSYDSDADLVTASGNVVLRSGDRSLRADSVSWSRRTGVILAEGRVRFVDENGNQLFSERVELTNEFEAGAGEPATAAPGWTARSQSRLRESDGTIALEQAAYSGCAVITSEGCPGRVGASPPTGGL